MGFYKQLSQTIYYILRSLKMIFTKKNMFFILFIAVFVACCIFSNKVFAEESVEVQTIEGIRAGSVGGGFTVLSDETADIYYFNTDSDYIYTITSNASSLNVFYSPTPIEVGTQCYLLATLPRGETYSFVGNGYYYFSWNRLDNINYSVTREAMSTYDTTISSLTQAISLDNLWGQFGVSLIALAVLFALGFLVVRKVLKKDSNYKG